MRALRHSMCFTSRRQIIRGVVFLVAAAGGAGVAAAQTDTRSDRSAVLKRMTLDDLINARVTTASKQSERLTETASAIQVITGEDIRRSGATSLAEALRLVPNLRVAQLNAYAWVVSARGFSGPFANKLLVMIDGRSVYTPLFAGVLWDVQTPLLEDIDRIEVVTGPGGSLWGSNAVNGVINVITKSATETRGAYVTAGGGSSLTDVAAVRYGGSAGPTVAWRGYAQRADRSSTVTATGADFADAWNMTHGGMRADWTPSAADAVTIDAALYAGTEETAPAHATVNGQHVLGRWTHGAAADRALTLQFYVDRTWRDDPPSTLTDRLLTTDIDLQQPLPLGSRHRVLWGAGYRLMQDDTAASTAVVALLPEHRDLHLFSTFVQDDIALVPRRLRLTIGTKLEHNTYSGFEWQPSGRVAWTPGAQHTVWGAVSRAVRTPSRLDVDYHIPAKIITIGTPGVNGGPEFTSEKQIAYEAGYRAEPVSNLSLAVSTFYNRYGDLYSVESVNGTATYQIENGTEGESWGLEVSDTYQAANWWRVRSGYTYFHKDLRSKPGHSFDSSSLGNDPTHQLIVHSILDVPGSIELDVVSRFVSALPSPVVRRYATTDVRVGKVIGRWVVALVGQNLNQARHSEFGVQDIRRSVYARVTWRLKP